MAFMFGNYCAHVDFEKAYDRVARIKFWSTLSMYGEPQVPLVKPLLVEPLVQASLYATQTGLVSSTFLCTIAQKT